MSRKSIFLLTIYVLDLYLCINYMLTLAPLHTETLANPNAVNWCKKLQWQTPPSPYLVALASTPGSGNTWLRYLLQQATGIKTGSKYLDKRLKRSGFPAENVTNGRVLVIKTHDFPYQDNFRMAVLLIRNPRDSILADFNRIYNGHSGTAPKSAFNGNKATTWKKHVSASISLWETVNTSWLASFNARTIHIVFYEDLVLDTRDELKKILDFLNFRYTKEDMDCAMLNKEGIYRRSIKHNFDPYTPRMHRVLKRVKDRVYKKISEFQEKGTYSAT